LKINAFKQFMVLRRHGGHRVLEIAGDFPSVISVPSQKTTLIIRSLLFEFTTIF